MNAFVCRFGRILGLALCAVLVAIPFQAGATEPGDQKKEAAARDSDLVRAANAAKKKAESTTYTNDDLRNDKRSKTTYTNEDLSRMFGPTEEASTEETLPRSDAPARSKSEAGDEAYDPLAAMEQQQQDRASRQQRIDQAESALAAAQAKLKSLEVQLLATKNPFSARPELSEEERTRRATSGETAIERNARTQKAVDDARVEVQKAEAELSRARSE